jgi:hypothetical protein
MADGTQSKAVATVEQSPRASGLAAIRTVQDAVPTLDTARFEHMQRIATVMAGSSLVPETLRMTGPKDKREDLPYETVLANCFLVVNQAVRWGMDPFAVAQCVSIVHGRICYEGKLVHAVVETKLGVRLRYTFSEESGEKLAVTVHGLLPGEDEERTVEGTVAQWKTTGANSPWTAPANWKRQLRYRGAREWARAFAPAVLLGIYSPDEMEDLVVRRIVDVTPGARHDALPKGPPPAPPRKAVAPPPPQPAEPFPDPDAYLAHLEEEMIVAADAATLDEVWSAHLSASDGRLPREHQHRAEGLYRKFAKDIAAKVKAKEPPEPELPMGG